MLSVDVTGRPFTTRITIKGCTIDFICLIQALKMKIFGFYGHSENIHMTLYVTIYTRAV